MQALLQRLKELDSRTFEQLCFHLLRARYPNADIRHVEGVGGDEGVDCFSGHLDDECTVWQSKAFPNGIGGSQKEQIKASLREALKKVRPVRWVLCLSVDLDIRAHRWWLRLRDSYRNEADLQLIQASDFVDQLIYYRNIREAFFPQCIMDVAALRASLGQTTDLSADRLGSLATEDAALYMDRLEQAAPRFAYEIIFHGNRMPPLSAARQDILATIQDSQKTINVFARDFESLKDDPPRGRFTLQGEGVTKLREHLETGKPLDILPGELAAFSSDFDVLVPQDALHAAEMRLSIRRQPQPTDILSFRLIFGDGPTAVIYDLIRFRVIAGGQKQTELQNLSKFPFKLTLLLSLGGTGTGALNLAEQLQGHRPTDIHRAATAILEMARAESLDIFDLDKSHSSVASAHSTDRAMTGIPMSVA